MDRTEGCEEKGEVTRQRGVRRRKKGGEVRRKK